MEVDSEFSLSPEALNINEWGLGDKGNWESAYMYFVVKTL